MKLLLTYKNALFKAFTALRTHYIVLLGVFVLGIIWLVATQLVGGSTQGWGMIQGLISSALLAFYYSWIRSVVDKERLRFKDLFEFDYTLFFTIIGASFMIGIPLLVLQEMSRTGSTMSWVYLCASLLVVILLNPLPEAISVGKSESSMEAIPEAFYFTKQYWIEWLLPVALLVLPIGLLYGLTTTVLVIAGSDVTLPFSLAMKALASMGVGNSLLFFIILIPAAHFYMLFRGFLFESLSSGRRRF